MRTLKRLPLLSAMLMALVAQPSLSDDTEIYFESGSGLGTAPQVMFHIEYNPNLASTICTGVTSENIDTSCPEIASVKLYMSPNDLDDGTIDQFELTRAALKRVLAPLGNLKIGLLMPHANDNNCAGPDETGCSAGGYILHRMVNLAAVPSGFDPDSDTDLAAVLAADSNKASLFNKLDALLSPQGNLSHGNQLKEIYFELFRYLTGQGVYNGHNGWKDFGTDTTYNLGDWATTPSANQGEYGCADGYSCASADDGSEYTSASGGFTGEFIALNNGNYTSTYPFRWDDSAEDGSSNYISPLVDCSRIFVINVLDGGGAQQNDADDAIALSLADGGMNFSPSNNDPGFVQMVQWLHDKDLADGSINSLELLDKQNVTSFFIAKQPQQVDAAAYAGGTGSAIQLTGDASSVVNTIEDVFSNILSVSTTFVAASIPVNVFNRSEVLDNTYLALFQANEDAQPSWIGNIKKLKLDIYQICQSFDPNDGTTCLEYENRLRLVDALGNPAISDTDGRIRHSARTFWTDSNGYDLYDNLSDEEVAGRDGRSVNRGGAGQQLPGFLAADGSQGTVSWTNSTTGRQLFTEDSGALLPIHYSNINALWPAIIDDSDPDYDTLSFWPQLYSAADTPASFSGEWATDNSLYIRNPAITDANCTTSFWSGSAGYAECYRNDWLQVLDVGSNIIAHIRGMKVKYDDTGNSPGDTRYFSDNGDAIEDVTSRRWITGDPLHSRPLPINYGPRGSYTEENPDIRLLVGSNGGFLRMIMNTEASGADSGKEVWGFMPRELLKRQKQLMDNAAGGDPIHPYGVDGSVSAYVFDTGPDGSLPDHTINAADGDKVWLYFGLRRGGRALYALDATDPDAPSFMWKITPDSTGFSELGYTFAQPTLRLLDWGHVDGVRPVLILSGGYDRDKDNNDPGTDDDIGNAIYIIDAQTGDLVWKATGSGSSGTDTYVNAAMVDSFPATATPVDSSGNGLIDQIYVGDTGGSVWRLDLHGNDRSNWQATKIMNLGRHYQNDLTNDRRFFHAADVVPARDANGRFMAVVIGSGNRAHPLQIHTTDMMFMYKDRDSGAPLESFTALTPNELFDATDNCIQEVGVDCSSTELAKLSNGWKMDLVVEGEKNLASPLTLRGTVYFSTYVPATSTSDLLACGPAEGSGFEYAISLQDASATIDYDSTNTVVVSGIEYPLQIEDRKRELKSGGVPSDHVYVSYTDEDGNNYTGVIPADLGPGKDLGKQQVRSFWYESDK